MQKTTSTELYSVAEDIRYSHCLTTTLSEFGCVVEGSPAYVQSAGIQSFRASRFHCPRLVGL